MQFSLSGLTFRSPAEDRRKLLFVLGIILFLVVLCLGCAEKEEPVMARQSYSCRIDTDAESGQKIVVLQREGPHPLVAKIAPGAGANLFSLVYEGKELIYGPRSLVEFDGSRPGTPVLYPTPNRVAGGKFSYGGRTFDFGINEKDRFIHGLVRSVPWEYEEPTADDNSARVLVYLDFSPGGRLYEKFGFDHRLSLLYELDEKGLRISYKVENRDSLELPYGFALHPYFNYLGPRRTVWLCVPAEAHMEAVDLMPTGKLEKLEGSPYDLTRPRPLAELVLDEVYYGMKPAEPAYFEYREAGIKFTLAASEEFTHMVVYVQPQNDFFCVENQTCSTDAHNLHARGLVDVAHLLVAPPGGESQGWVHYIIEPL